MSALSQSVSDKPQDPTLASDTSVITSNTPASAENKSVMPKPKDLAFWLRSLGSGAVILSAIVYMLQGVHYIDAELRNWMYLGLTAGLAVGGILSRMSFKDPKGARLFFTLAIALIPVQFSQLGGMVLSLLPTDTQHLPTPLIIDGINYGSTIFFGGITLLIYGFVAYTGFSILARSAVKVLIPGFLLVNALLLLPLRTSVPGFAIVALLSLLAVAWEYRYFQGKSLFKTIEGKSIRWIFIIPLLIAAARWSFYIEDNVGYCAMGLLIATILIHSPASLITHRLIREITSFIGCTLAGFSWLVLCTTTPFIDAITYDPLAVTITLLPIAAIFVYVAQRAHWYSRFYRLIACFLVVINIANLILDHSTLTSISLGLTLSSVLCVFGYSQKYREPMLVGIVSLCANLIALLTIAINDVTFNGWLSLAVGGIVLVLTSSIVERFGKSALQDLRNTWTDVSRWQ